jgi:flagellar motor component MotA
VIVFTAYKFNFFQELLEKDSTKLSFFLLLILLVVTFWIGSKIFFYTRNKVESKEDSINDLSIFWFIGEACLAIGLVGTVTGFIIMLGTTFIGLDVSNTSSMQDALVKMSIGMSTALYTTLIGLLSSLSIKVQIINFERAIQKSQ